MKASSAGARLNEAALIQRQAERDSEPVSEKTESVENLGACPTHSRPYFGKRG